MTVKVVCEAIHCRAVRADDVAVRAHVEEDMRVIVRRVRTDTHKLLRADFDHRHTGIVMEVGDHMIGHEFKPWKVAQLRRQPGTYIDP